MYPLERWTRTSFVCLCLWVSLPFSMQRPGAADSNEWAHGVVSVIAASGGFSSLSMRGCVSSGKGASRPLPSGLPARKVMTDNPLASIAGQPIASRPSPADALRAALTRPSAPRNQTSWDCYVPHETTRDHDGPLTNVATARRLVLHPQTTTNPVPPNA